MQFYSEILYVASKSTCLTSSLKEHFTNRFPCFTCYSQSWAIILSTVWINRCRQWLILRRWLTNHRGFGCCTCSLLSSLIRKTQQQVCWLGNDRANSKLFLPCYPAFVSLVSTVAAGFCCRHWFSWQLDLLFKKYYSRNELKSIELCGNKCRFLHGQ